jgi:hypothetical protein
LTFEWTYSIIFVFILVRYFQTPFYEESNMSHLHIRWANGRFDWQTFATEAEAIREAERLAQTNEHFTIQQFDGDCALCAARRSRFSQSQASDQHRSP